MANDYFQLKEFIVRQERCAMKVSTDACIQGAWAAIKADARLALDIGCGTGLLSLMLAQRFDKIAITAIEIAGAAAQQAQENFDASAWHDRFHIVEGDARAYTFAQRFDFIICNPPFFHNSLHGHKPERNIARHNISLSLEGLFDIIQSNLKQEGAACVLLPVETHERWLKILRANDWHLSGQLDIHPREGKPANRIVSICSRAFTEMKAQAIAIKNKHDDGYTHDFIQLMKPFYLHL